MKKIYYVLFVTVLIACVVMLFSKNEAAKEEYKAETFTSEQLIAQYKANKAEKRAAGYSKFDHPDEFVKYINYLKTGDDPSKTYPINYKFTELKSAKQRRAMLKSAKVNLDWKHRGPGNVAGRTRTLLVDPDDTTGNTWFVGAVGGGVWKTIDAGQNWEFLSTEWPNIAVCTLAMGQSNTNVIYAGTGEAFFNADAIMGDGIFKSTDKGQTWVQLASTVADNRFRYVSRLIVNPANENEVLAATSIGIFKSTNGGTSWTDVYNGNNVQDLIYHPTDFNIQFAGEYDKGILASTDGGDTWSLRESITTGRIELCISKVNPDYVFALDNTSELYLSIDGGLKWEKTVYDTKVVFLGQQGFYNNALAAHPSDENKLFIGGQFNISEVTVSKVSGSESIELGIENTTAAYLDYRNISGSHMDQALLTFNLANDALARSVQIRFGNGASQKAHRFTVGGTTATKAFTESHIYEDYVDVPFEVIDINTGNQIMVSFRDQDENGVFDVSENSLEQIFIHSTEYSATTPSPDIAKNGGIVSNLLYFFNPLLKTGVSNDVSTWPLIELKFIRTILEDRKITSKPIAYWNAPVGSAQYAHADHHNLTIVENAGNPFRIINGNDGGVNLSDDGGVTWTFPIGGYVTTQFYGIAKHPTKNKYFGGTQDNGTFLSTENPDNLSNWTFTIGGDGFEAIWHPYDGQKFAGSQYYNSIYITKDGGQNWSKADFPETSQNYAPFITRLTNAPSDPEMMMTGGLTWLWTSYDFGDTWNKVVMPDGTWPTFTAHNHTEISPVNSRYVWAGKGVSTRNNFSVALSSDGGRSFIKSSIVPNGAAALTNIVAHPTDFNTAYLVFAKSDHAKIYRTSNLGQTWEDITGFNGGTSSSTGFPDVAVYTMVVMPHNTDILWAGTEIGIFESTDGGQSWHYADNGLPAVCIWDMKIVGQQVVVGTHGLGIWTLDIPEIEVSRSPYISEVGKQPNGSFGVDLELFNDCDQLEFYVDGQLEKVVDNVVTGRALFEVPCNVNTATVDIQAIAITSANNQYSNYKRVDNPVMLAAVPNYTNDFSVEKSDFRGNLSVKSSYFNNWAIHSPHPYKGGIDQGVMSVDYSYTLKYPIIISEDVAKASMTYRDIAFVEQGTEGSVYGDDTFWDYVVVEGTKDGVNWLPLKDGYDVGYSQKWLDYTTTSLDQIPNSEDLFETHIINLQDVFAADDIILVRFRMYSDYDATGWGWMIDDVEIQKDNATALFASDANVDGSLTVSPNPVQNGQMNLQLDTEEIGEMTLVVYGVNGRVEFNQTAYKDHNTFAQTIHVPNVGKGLKVVSATVNGKTYTAKVLFK
ncbi:hypothetical protein [Carboxylicivirga marina]|uniref:Uncharacterized protein n=1 Tax=Carboxylicivirga marina TaxID=2800988 RepID=A0ABS1HQE5_9BACT|nr:hypothetical protein [Carboxylicivirga marina]MBK3519899.1 hypothetical protein [Carboxylicivirga marina]